jgi:hypothetical protein|tara:strand:- start:374 stop:829 length:456 start_codon:yes stop_codon:yes gene_type:complete
MITTLRRDIVTDDPRYEIDKARKVYVYKNLHRNCYSVKQDGLVKMHADSICLWDASFRVGQKGREKVLKEQRKNVHAGVTGYIDTDWDSHSSSPTNFRGVIYNPYSHKTFVCADIADRSAWLPVFHSPRVRLSHVKGKARIDAEESDSLAK